MTTITIGDGGNFPSWASAVRALCTAVSDVRLACGPLVPIVDRMEGRTDEVLEHEGVTVVLERVDRIGFLDVADLYPTAAEIRRAAEVLAIICAAIEEKADDPWPDPFEEYS